MATLTRKQQKKFVKDLCDGLARSAIAFINEERIPEAWDGHELRQLIADNAELNVSFVTMSGKRKREYENTRMVNGF